MLVNFNTLLLPLVWTCIASATDIDQLQKLQDDFWDWRMRENPTSSTWDGMYKYNDLMESFSISNFEIRRNETLEFRSRLNAINRENLDKPGHINYAILNDTLETFLEGNKWAEYGALSPLSFIGGIQMYSGPSMAPSDTRGDFENYIVRLHAVQTQVDEIIELGRRAIELNRTLNNVSIAKLPGQIDTKIFENPVHSSYYSVFTEKLDNSHVTDEAVRADIRERGRLAVIDYMDAFKKLKAFIVDEYMPATRDEWGVSAWDPSGEYYKACLKWHLSFEMTPGEVHNKGRDEVARITGKMEEIMTKLNFNGTIAEFFKSLENDTRFYTTNRTAILEYYEDVVFNRIAAKLHLLFKNIPDVPLEIRASAFDGLGGGYSSASETSPGRFTINLFRPLEVPLFETMALSLHEANPGHHLQHSYSMKANLPDFRRDPMLSFYNIPNWFPYYSAYGEGWGLYSEYLGEEMDLYHDDYEMMGRYSYEILRACRLVVDTGLHAFGWTRDQAIEYLQNHTALAGGSAENEIDRYITWPGQACAYKVGEIKIKALRQQAEQELGNLFHVQDFHLLVLENGAVPMSVLEQLVTDWITDVKNTPTTAAPTTPITSEATKEHAWSKLFAVFVAVTVCLLYV